MEQKIKWKEYYNGCLPIEDNYLERKVLCKWEDGSISTEWVRYERIIGDVRRKYEGHFDCIIKPKYYAEIE